MYDKRLLIAGLTPVASVFNQFAGQSTVDENCLAIDMGNAAPFVVKGFDLCQRHDKVGLLKK